MTETGRKPPLRKMTSAAYGEVRDSVAEATAERCPVSPFFATTALSEGLPGEEKHTRHTPSRVLGALEFWGKQMSNPESAENAKTGRAIHAFLSAQTSR